jgi:hypothetical protein
VAITRLSGGLTPADGADPRTFPAVWNGTADDLEAGEYSKVPQGGSAGEVLVKQSATDFASGWQRLYPYNKPPAVGDYIREYSFGTTATTPLNNNEVQASTIFVLRPVKVDEIAIEVTASAVDGVGRLGIYAADADGFPSDLLVDAGTYDASTPGVKAIALSPAVTLPEGLNYLVNVRQGAGSYSVRRTINSSAGAMYSVTAANAVGANPNSLGFRRSSVSGALPATFGTPTQNSELALIKMAVRVSEVL